LYGFINGLDKIKLIQKSSFLLYPSKNDAFPLTLLEMFSHGLPVLTSTQGSIADIVDEKSGVVVTDLNDLEHGFQNILENYLNIDTAKYCRKRYLDNFSLEQFEENLIKVLK
jgi:glycosyltransferase involved in cell wall biosynthesis